MARQSLKELENQVKTLLLAIEATKDHDELARLKHDLVNAQMVLDYREEKQAHKTKTLQVSEEVHSRLKKRSNAYGETIYLTAEEILRKALGMLMVCFIFVSCATKTEYIYVDKPNMKRYEHKQKIKVGMHQREVMFMFGSPDEATRVEGMTRWSYYNKIFCQASAYKKCYVYFNSNELVRDTVRFRQEFDRTLVDM